VAPDGEGGLLGIAVSPLFIHDSFLYAYLTSATENRIVRFHLVPDDTEPADVQVVVDGIAKSDHHDGGSIAFGPDGMLYAGTGDAGDPSSAQDTDSLNGKILRMTPVGEPPPDNPIPGSVVWSWGHRNVQGLAWDGAGRLWASELGQNTWDEVNLIEPAHNYGWPVVEGDGDTDGGRFTNPQVTWSTDEASPSGAAIVPGEDGDTLYVAALRGERLWQVPLGDGVAGTPEALLDDQYGRLRGVALSPDGSLWITTSNRDGRGDPYDGDDRLLAYDPAG
jgi:glucose/arabinose dehydrogenase